MNLWQVKNLPQIRMRWLHYDPLCVEEVEFRAGMTARFQRFWSQFTERVSVLENAISGGTAWDWRQWLTDLLANVEPRWQWEIMPDQRSDRQQMTISARSHRTTRPMLRDFLDAGPQIPGWIIGQWLPPMAYPVARRFVRGRTDCDCDHLAVKVIPNRHRLDLQFVQSPDAPPASTKGWLATAAAAGEALLGEERFDRYLGSIVMTEVEHDRRWWRKLKQGSPREAFYPIAHLPQVFEAAVIQLREQLPPVPLSRLIDAQGWTTVEVEPASGAAHSRRHDLRLLTASLPALAVLRAAHDMPRFRSDLHSRFGEQFCYVQWEHDTSTDQELLSRREAIDSALAAALNDSASGCVVGGGIGEAYLYFDLAITDMPAAIPLIRRTLLEQDPPHACWLRFFDEELAAEWVGIHPEAAEPPELA